MAHRRCSKNLLIKALQILSFPTCSFGTPSETNYDFHSILNFEQYPAPKNIPQTLALLASKALTFCKFTEVNFLIMEFSSSFRSHGIS